MVTSDSTIIARYAETDQMGVVHHAVYPVWFEVARTDFIKLTGVAYSELERWGVMTPLASLSCNYRQPCRYEDVLTIRTRIKTLTAGRIEFGYEVLRGGEERPICTGSTLHGWVDAKTFRPVNMKRRFPELYAKMERMMGDGDGAV